MALTAEQTALLTRLTGPEAWAFYLLLTPTLDLDGLLADAGGEMRQVAAQVLEYAALMARVDASAAGGAVDIKLGSLSVKADALRGLNALQADAWTARAQALRAQLETLRRRAAQPRTTSVPIIFGGL